MPRSIRLQHEGAWHHVMNRGGCHRRTFVDSTDRLLFLDLLGRSARLTGLEVHGYCLVGNHFHLLVRTPKPNLDRAMQLLLGSYTRNFNDRHGRDGALFRGRYKSILIDDERYLMAVSRYVHRNALDVGALEVADWPWSSYPAYIGLAPPKEWLHRNYVLTSAGGRVAYQRLVESPLDSEVDRFYE